MIMKFRRVKALALFLIICMFLGVVNINAFAKEIYRKRVIENLLVVSFLIKDNYNKITRNLVIN